MGDEMAKPKKRKEYSTEFFRRFPKFAEWIWAKRSDKRIEWSIATMAGQIADAQRIAQKHEMGVFFSQSPAHMILKWTITRNALIQLKDGDGRVGTPIHEVLNAMGTPPSLRTKQEIINEACDRKFLFKYTTNKKLDRAADKSEVKIMPTDLLLIGHLIEGRTRLENVYQNNAPYIAIEMKESVQNESWIPELDLFLSVENQHMLGYDKNMFGDMD